jgi:hypothetical protein
MTALQPDDVLIRYTKLGHEFLSRPFYVTTDDGQTWHVATNGYFVVAYRGSFPAEVQAETNPAPRLCGQHLSRPMAIRRRTRLADLKTWAGPFARPPCRNCDGTRLVPGYGAAIGDVACPECTDGTRNPAIAPGLLLDTPMDRVLLASALDDFSDETVDVGLADASMFRLDGDGWRVLLMGCRNDDHLAPVYTSWIHIETPRLPNWCQTFTGRAFYPFDPRPEDIDPGDIAHALAHICRYGGHSRRFYSVAEHAVRCSQIVPPEDALWALLHDAAEAYVGDMVRPLKTHPGLAFFQETEDRILRAVCDRFGLPHAMPDSVKRADEILCATEARDLMRTQRFDWHLREAPLPAPIRPWKPKAAKRIFLDRLGHLSRLHDGT